MVFDPMTMGAMALMTGTGALMAGKGTKPGTQQNLTLLQSLQPNMQNQINRVDVGINDIPLTAQQQNRRFYSLKPGDPGFSQAAFDRQMANPDVPIESIGLEPFNATQNAALDQYGDPIGSLAQYMQPIQRQMNAYERRINKENELYRNELQGQHSRANRGSNPAYDARLQSRLDQIEQDRQDRLADAEAFLEEKMFNQARQYRQESLQDMMFGGNLRHQFAQQAADQTNAYNQTINHPAYQQAKAINEHYAPLMGGGGTVTQPRVTALGQLGGLMMRAPQMYGSINNMSNGMYGTPWNFANPYGNTMGQFFGG